MRTVLDEIKRPRRVSLRPLLAPTLTILIPLALLLVFRLVRGQKAWMNAVIQWVTTPIKRGVSWLCDLAPFAVGEWLIALAALAAVIFLVRTVFLLIARPHRLMRLARRLLALIAAAVLVYSGYTLFWGVNYYGSSFSDRSGIVTRDVSTDELYALTVAFAEKCASLSDQVRRDDEGHFAEDLDDLFQRSDGLYDAVAVEFPFLSAPEREAKQLFFSRAMSYLDFTGFFFPFTGEALLNTDAPACLIPSTILHEKAHQRNVAAEQEANFVAIVAGLRCDDVAFQYSSALMGYIHLYNALSSADSDLAAQARAKLSDSVRTDLADNHAYWAQFDTPVQTVSNTVYEEFLYSYDQDLGMRSYGACVDLLVAYYCHSTN